MMLLLGQVIVPEAIQILLRSIGEIAVVLLIAGCLYYCFHLLRGRHKDDARRPIGQRRRWIYVGISLCLLAALPFYCRWRCAWLSVERGDQAVQIQRWEAARHSYQAALRYKSAWPQARARLLFVESEPVLNLDDNGWSISSSEKSAHAKLCIIQDDKPVESWRQKVDSLQKAVALDASWAPSHMALGVALFRIDKRQQAENEFRAAVRLTPNYPQTHILLAACLGSRAALEESIFQYREAVRCQPNDAWSRYCLSVALLCKDDLQGKEELLQAAGCLSQHTGDFSTAFKIGCALQGLSSLKESREAYRFALQSAGSAEEKAQVLLLLASLLYEVRDVEQAKREWEALLAFDDATLTEAAIAIFGADVRYPWERTTQPFEAKYYGKFDTHPRKWAQAGAFLCEVELASARQRGQLPALSADPFRVYKVTSDGGVESYEGNRPGLPGGRYIRAADGKLGANPPHEKSSENGPITAIDVPTANGKFIHVAAGGLFTFPRDEAGKMPWVPKYCWPPTIIVTNCTPWQLRVVLVRPIGVASPDCFPEGADRHVPWPVQGHIEISLKSGEKQTIHPNIMGGHYLNGVIPAVTNDAEILPLVEMVRIVGQPGVDFMHTSTHLTYNKKQFMPGEHEP